MSNTDDTDPETYNTITSLSALTRLLPPELLVEHVARLPSRRHRRLSQCLEEDESEDLGLPQSPRHTDPVFVDTSLVAIKKEAPKEAVSLSDGSDLWVRRVPIKKKEVGVLPSGPETMLGPHDVYRTTGKSETWNARGGAAAAAILARAEAERRGKGRRGDQVYHTVTGAVSTSHSRASHPPSIFEVFRPRSKSDANTKKPNLIGQVKNAMTNSLKSQNSGSEGEHSRGPVAKVIHLFRHRSQSAVSAEEKRKAKAAAIQQQQIAAHSALRRSSLEKRRLSLGGGVTGHRGSEPSLDPNHAAILFRDSRGLPVADPFLEKVSISDLEEDESQIFVKFFKFHRCYGLIPTSAKLVVFDTQLLVKKAFFALLHNGVRAAPLWDASQHKFVGMLTITDFIKILHMYYRSGTMSLEQMEEHKLDTWRALLKDSPDLVSIGPDASLYDAIRVLILNRIHRLPVIDPETGNVLYILTHKRILRFLFLYINDLPRPSYLDKSLSEVGIGTYDCIETAFEDTTIISALDKFLDRRVSALPVVDSEGKLVDIFAKFDVINLAAEKTYDKLDMPLKKANENRNDWFEGVHKCSMDDTLYSIIERLVRAEVHRLVVTDDEDKVIGILSLSDLLQYLVLRPCGDEIGLGSRCESPLSQLQSEETILEGEEEESDSLEPLSNNTNFAAREVTVSGGE